MYFKTPKDSDTGQKAADVYRRGKEAWDARRDLIVDLMKEFPTMTGEFREPGGLIVWGGLFSIMFSEEPDENIWIKVDEGEYMPLETEEGKEIAEKVYTLPVVKYTELNACLNHHDAKHVIGFKVGEDYFGFEVNPKWGVKIPSDCQEITYSEFANL